MKRLVISSVVAVCVLVYCDHPPLVGLSYSDNSKNPFRFYGTRERRAWTEAGSDDAWLALDRNGTER